MPEALKPVRIHDHEIGPWAVADASTGRLKTWGIDSKAEAEKWIAEKGYAGLSC